MKYYKNKDNEIYAYEEIVKDELIGQKVKELGLTPISVEEADELLAPIDEKAKALAQLEADITECKDDIKHALIIGNSAVLETLREEYKELIAEREKLNVTSEPTTVAPTDHL